MNENDKLVKKPAARPGRRAVRRGTIAAGTTAVIIAIVVVLNLIVGQLPSNIREKDISDKKVYTVSDTARSYLGGLTKDVEIILVAEDSAKVQLSTGADVVSIARKYLQNFAAVSGHVKFTAIDPVKYTSVLDEYGCQANSVVVKCDETGKHKVVNLLGYDGYSSGIMLLDYQAASQGYGQASSFDGDGQLVSAIDYVTGSAQGSAFLTTGHGESSLPSGASGILDKMNVTVSSDRVNLLMAGAVPDGCDLLICYLPTTDLSAEEVTLLENYMKAGGNLMLVIDAVNLQNFNGLLAEYGMQMQSGKIGDTSRVYMQFYSRYGAYCIAPTLSQTSDLTSGITAGAMLVNSHGMLTSTPARSSITVDPFMTTSDTGVCFVSDSNTQKGTYVMGAVATEPSSSNSSKTSRFTVITTASLMADDVTQYPSLSNTKIATNAFAANFSSVSNVSIPARSLAMSYNVISSYKFWSVLFIAVLPLGCIAGGLVYWSRRRKH